MMQQADLKRLKEEFVSNLHGTTKWEVFCVVSCLPLCLLVAAYAEAWVQARCRASGKALRKLLRIPKFCYEFSIVVVPQILLLMSVAPAEPAFLLLFLLWGSLALKLWMKLAHSPGSKQHMLHVLNHISTPRKRSVSAFRGGLMLVTCLSILAVDFTAFPRRYAKAESYGAGVMDIGVGAIVWAGGLVSAAAAAATAAAGTDSSSTSPATTSSDSAFVRYTRRVIKGSKTAVPLLLLGGGRLILTAAVGYQQHLGEYGLHWNFFWTIAAVNIATLAIPVPPAALALAGLSVTAAHQLLLSLDLGLTPSGSMSDWIAADLSEQQRSISMFWAANKEGLGSLPGYWALHLLGAAVGRYLAVSCAAAAARARSWLLPYGGGSSVGFRGSPGGGSVSECARELWSWVGRCLLLDLVVWGLLWAAEMWVEPISRRSCNMSYVLWTTAQCLAWLLLCLITDILTVGLSGGSSSSGPGSLLSGRMKGPAAAAAAVAVAGESKTSSAAAAGSAPAAGNVATAAVTSNSASAATGLKSRVGRRQNSGSSPAAVAAALGAASTPGVEGSGVAASPVAAAAAAAVRQVNSAPNSPVKTKRHIAAAPGFAGLMQTTTTAAAVGGLVQGSPSSSSTSSGGNSSPERQRRQLSKHHQQQQQHQQSVAAGGSPVSRLAPEAANASSYSSNSGPMRLVLAFNRNMLALFLLGNVLTGAVNLSINTLAMGNWTARTLVGVYMLVLCGAAVMMHGAGLALKPW